MNYTIGQVSKKTGLSSHTIRYYEKEGVLPHVNRNDAGIRCFSEDDLFWIDTVNCLKRTGMTISDIKYIVNLSKVGDSTIPERKEILKSHRKNLEQQIIELHQSIKKIDKKIDFYEKGDDCSC